MATNLEHAEKIIAAYIKLRRNSEQLVLSYGQLAELIDRPGEHRLLGAALDLVGEICRQRGLPDIATVVVSAESLKRGTLQPSSKALDKYSGWPNLRAEQARVIGWDWTN